MSDLRSSTLPESGHEQHSDSVDTATTEHQVLPAEKPEHHEHAEHIEYTDAQIERAHEVLGISGKPYLILESDAAKMAERDINVDDYLKQHDTSFFAPGALPTLLKKNKWNQVHVDIGKNSNVQEIDRLEITQGQKVNIRIGEGSSIAHAVKFVPSDGREVDYQIGNNVFIGIGTHLAEGKIGNNCNVGFNCRLENDVELGDYVTICDGARIEEEIKLEPFTVIPPGLVVTREIAEKPAVSPEEYAELNKNATKAVEVLIRFSPAQQQEILKAEKEQNGVSGNLKANTILDKAGVEASSLFLTQFNRIVVSENRLFPLMYRLIGKFHPEHIQNNDRSTEGSIYGNNVQVVDLPVNRTAFIKHYMDQVEQGVTEDQITPYQGEFTVCRVDWEQTRFKGDTQLIGPVEMEGKNDIGKHFIVRYDEGKPGEKLLIKNCRLGEYNTFHASGNKTLNSVEAGNECVFHGAIDIAHTALGNSIILHNVNAFGSNLHGNSILLGATIIDSTIAPRNTIIGHFGHIDVTNTNTGNGMVILTNAMVLGNGKSADQLLWFGNGSKIRENSVVYGQGDIPRNQLFGPNGVYEVIPGNFRKLEMSEADSFQKGRFIDEIANALVTVRKQLQNESLPPVSGPAEIHADSQVDSAE
jgi:carbonic anhydrase/acetyltransferase-like protein (isoleucine patch superfamily)